MAATRESIPTWGKHAEGAAALVKYRGAQMLQSDLSKRLYWAVLAQQVINQIAKCQAIDPDLSADRVGMLYPDLLTMNNSANRLTLLGLRVPALREAGARCLQAPINPSVAKDVLKLLEEARDVDRAISEWPLELPASWKYKSVRAFTCSPDAIRASDYYPGPVDIYSDLSVANVWNTYRGYRVHCLTIILNCIERLVPPQSREEYSVYNDTIEALKNMVDGICASVPFHLGLEGPLPSAAESVCPTSTEEFFRDDTSLPRFTPDQGTHLRMSKRVGGVYLIWSLFVAQSVICIPKVQRTWIMERFKSISTHYGINQADVLVDLGIESFGKGRSSSITDYAPPPYVPFDIDTE